LDAGLDGGSRRGPLTLCAARSAAMAKQTQGSAITIFLLLLFGVFIAR
jgi:hypothetical protein